MRRLFFRRTAFPGRPDGLGRPSYSCIAMRRRWAVCLLLAFLSGCGRRPPYAGRSVAELQAMLDDPSPTVQAQAAYGLSLHHAKARPALPALTRTLRSPDALVRQQSALALGEIGAEAEEAVPALIEALHDAEWSVRRQAALALGQIGPPARAAEKELVHCQRDHNSLVRKAAGQALAKIK
ncbi:MAG TPA: HEAT repeat domain-containing protein [Gemmataceae bacterium]|nr:HEAT repeat domain-containing protein [Gemmataceae bacterium]